MKAKTKTKKQIPEIVVIAFLVALPFILGLCVQGYIAFSSTSFYNNTLLNLSNSELSLSQCNKFRQLADKNRCITKLAVNSRNEVICDYIEEYSGGGGGYYGNYIDVMPRVGTSFGRACRTEVQNAIISFALNSSNYLDCKENSECLLKLAVYLNDTQYCYNFNEENVDRCVSEISYRINDSFLCSNISSIPNQSQCYYHFSSFSPNEKICQLITDETNYSCYNDFAHKLKNQTICNLSGPNKAECFFSLALELNNSNNCDKTGEHKDECFFTIAKRNNDSTDCLDAGRYRSECSLFFAKSRLDANFCIGLAEQGNCVYEIAFATNDSSICSYANEYASKCYSHFAVMYARPELCFKSPLQVDVGCVIAASNGSIAYCEYVPEIADRTQCYRGAALASGNFSYCLNAGNYRDNCLFSLASSRGRIKECDGAVGAECIKILYNISV